MGLVKVPRDDRHVYATPETAATGNAYDARLARLLEDIPVRIGRSGLSLVLVATPGSAGAIAQAIDQSSLTDQVGTLAGDNTALVLFETEAALERGCPLPDISTVGRVAGPNARLFRAFGGSSMNKVVLAYSGGLDTSVAVACCASNTTWRSSP